MKRIFNALILASAFMVSAAEIETLYPSSANWRIDGSVEDNKTVELVNTSPSATSSMSLWVKVQAGQKLTFRATIRGKDIAAKQKPYQGVRFFLWGMVNGKSTEFGQNHHLKGNFGWTELTNTVEVPVDFDGWLKIGLREVTGTLYVKNITLETDGGEKKIFYVQKKETK